MRRIILLFVFLVDLISVVYSINATSETILPHPRILLLKGEEKKIQENFLKSKVWNEIQNEILIECDRILLLPCLERTIIGKRLLNVSREALRRIFFLSYAHRITNEQKYLKRAEQELLSVSHFENWNPSHFLDVAEMTMAVSIGYDWLYNNLSETSRKTIKDAILFKGIEPSFEIENNGFLKTDNNWNQVCNAGMVYGALAIYEDVPQLSKQVINQAVETLRLPMKNYGPDGTYAEGYGYWEYGTSFNVMFLAAIEKIYKTDFGLTHLQGFLNTANYYENMVGSSGASFNYADCEDSKALSPAMFWFSEISNNKSLLWNERKLLSINESNNFKNRLLPAAIIWGSNIDPDSIIKPGNLIWIGQGTAPVALMRTSWIDSKAIFVGFKGGTASSNHSHMDVGSFVMEANGVRWAMDFGMQNYESLESKGVKIWDRNQESQRWSVFRYNNFAHNTLTINDRLHRVNGYAKIDSYSSDSDFISSTADLSSVFHEQLASCMRGVAIVDKQYVLISDEIKTLADAAETKIRWSMLTSANVKIKNKNSIELVKNGEKLLMKIEYPGRIAIKTWSTKSKNDFDADNTGTILVGFEIIVPKNSIRKFSVVLLPEGARYTKPLFSDLCDWYKNNN